MIPVGLRNALWWPRLIRSFHLSGTLRKDEAISQIGDTNRYKEELVSQGGFTEEQAVALTEIVGTAVKQGVRNVAQELARRDSLSQLQYQQRVDFAKLRDQLMSADRIEFHNLQNEYERVRNELDKLKNQLREEISKSNAGFKLDLSLEKGRIREESSHQDLSIKEIDTRIDQEVNNMRMQIDSVKTQVMQWLIGVCTGSFALVLAYIRLLS